jgi:endonuclease YncB( thermonuclease family)
MPSLTDVRANEHRRRPVNMVLITAGGHRLGFFRLYLIAMSPVIPFRRRSRFPNIPFTQAALAALMIGATAIAAYMTLHNGSTEPSPIEVIDSDTVRFSGAVYRLVGFDTPERGDKARCDEERRHAEAATTRLRGLIGSGDARLIRVACACRPGQEGTRNCNFGRLCGSLLIGGQDVGGILISEGLAHYVCGATSCPQRRPWC